ncbi:MAG: hypothetical protein MPW13_12405 [Candidatus Manganitrophus sp.]|nr:hypothetical protein [Candidatus Manganitrophus sp.]
MAREKEITSVLNERRLFKPKKEFSKAAHLSSLEAYKRLYRKAEKNPEAFWAGLAKELSWFKPWKKVLEWKPPSPSGLSAARSISPTIASTVTWRAGGKTRRRSSGKGSRATRAS